MLLFVTIVATVGHSSPNSRKEGKGRQASIATLQMSADREDNISL